jgi:hypothetical protein
VDVVAELPPEVLPLVPLVVDVVLPALCIGELTAALVAVAGTLLTCDVAVTGRFSAVAVGCSTVAVGAAVAVLSASAAVAVPGTPMTGWVALEVVGGGATMPTGGTAGVATLATAGTD